MSVRVDLDDDTVDRIGTAWLQRALCTLREELERRERGDEMVGVFHREREKDTRAIRKRIRAIERTLEYCGLRDEDQW